MKYLIAAAVLATGIAAVTSAPASAQPQQICLQKNMVDGWKVVNDRTLIVNDRVGRQYTVTLARGCHDLKWPDSLGWTSSTGFVAGCIGHNDFLLVPPNGANIAQRCLIENVQPIIQNAQR